MSAQPPSEGSPFAIKVDSGLFLDSENKFHSAAPEGAKVYELGGGILSLSTELHGQVLSGTLAVIPLKNEPSWKDKLRKIGVDEEVLDFFEDAAGFATCVVSVIGWVQAAMKLLEWLGFLKGRPSLEELVIQILTKLSLVQDMVAETQESGGKIAIDSSRGPIESAGDSCAEDFRILNEDATRFLYTKNERKAMRHDMMSLIRGPGGADGHYRNLLSPSRWRFICQSKLYRGSWGFYTDPEEYTVTNPPWWRRVRHVPRQQLADDGVTWVPAVYPAAYKGRFDYRPALPHAIHGGLKLISMVQMVEPEFRTTGFMRGALLDYANAVEDLMKQMRSGFVRSHYTAADFRYVDASNVIGPLHAFTRPLFYWQVGALDLCAHIDAYFDNLATKPSAWPAAPYKLGGVNFDWVPSSWQLRWVDPPDPGGPGPGSGYWEITNPEECAEEANKQSEADYFVILQASGYFQLAQLHATLKHLATDPERSETVGGSATTARTQIDSRTVKVTGYDGLFCEPITATGTLKEYHCHTTLNITTQEPDRVHKVPTTFWLVALEYPADWEYAPILSEVELSLNSVTLNPKTRQKEISLPAVSTFDYFVENIPLGKELWAPSIHQLQYIRKAENWLPSTTKERRAWIEGVPDFSNELPFGDVRNKKLEPVTFDCEFAPIDTDARQGAWIRIGNQKGTRNIDNLYVATEETLSSSNKLRTYFKVEMYAQITYVPPSFFRQERECLVKTAGVLDEIERRFSESAPPLPSHVPVTVEILQNRASQVRAAAPDLVEDLIRRSPESKMTQE